MATTTLEEKRRQTIERNKRKLAQLGVKSAAKTIKKQVKGEEEKEAEVLKKRKKKSCEACQAKGARAERRKEKVNERCGARGVREAAAGR